MGSKMQPMPYIDFLLEKLWQGDGDFVQAFGRHLHWGYWDGRAAGTLADFAEAAERMTRRMCQAAGIRNGMRVLDAGCGLGGTLASLNVRFADLAMVGLNIDGRQLDWARQHVLPKGRNAVGFIQANACRLPFADRSFDVVLAVECIFHFPSRTRFLREAHRVLRPGGRLTLSDFVPRGAALPALALLLPFFSGAFTRFYGNLKAPCTLSRYRALARRARFSALAYDDITSHTLPTYAALRRFRRKREAHGADEARATGCIEWMSRAGLVRYVILSCDRNDSG